jgi:hypothetical protein
MWRKTHGCVTIGVRDDDGIFQEIMDEVPPLCVNLLTFTIPY